MAWSLRKHTVTLSSGGGSPGSAACPAAALLVSVSSRAPRATCVCFHSVLIRHGNSQSVLLIFLTQWDQSTLATERLREQTLKLSHLIIVQ